MSQRVTLEALAEKYDRLLALHRAQPERSPARRQSMDEVAQRFPGALREWQALSVQRLQARRDAIQGWLAGDPDAVVLPSWVHYSLALHAWLRLLLRLRQHALSQVDSPCDDGAWLATAQTIAATLGEGALSARLTPALRAAVDRPPAGQLSRLAYAEIAAQFGVAESEIKDVLFGAADATEQPA